MFFFLFISMFQESIFCCVLGMVETWQIKRERERERERENKNGKMKIKLS